MSRLLVLRPEPGASATMARARERGLDAIAIPLFEIAPVQWEAPEPGRFDGLLLTSANAVRCGGDQLRQLRELKVYAVGDATAEAARDSGFDIAATGDSDVERLLGSIDPDLHLLHLCGENHSEPKNAQQRITRSVVYRSNPLEARDLSGLAGSVALIHSPRAGQRFAELVRDRASICIAAISEAAAKAAGPGWKAVQTAESPTDNALLALAARLCNNPRSE